MDNRTFSSKTSQYKSSVTIDADAQPVSSRFSTKRTFRQIHPLETDRYDPDLIIDYYRRRPLQVLARLLSVATPFLLFSFNLWWDRYRGKGTKNQRRRAIQMRDILTTLGPTYIKIGQALSTRPDLVPAVYLEELSRLQDQLPSFPNQVAYRFIEEELGAPPQEIYAYISQNPVAAASLGQVYQGRLKTGETVAVKVQRPDLIQGITRDIYIIRSLATWATANIKRVRSDLIGIADEFARRIFEEMNYVQEGQNAQRFEELYGYMEEIYVPKIHWDYTGRRVLTMEWITGIKLTNLEEVQAQGIDATHLVEVGVECSLRQLLEHGFFHADPHPGNLLAMADGKLAYLDFGMMSDIKPYQRYGLIDAIVHLVNRDFEALAHDYVHLEFLTPETDLTPIIPALTEVFGNALGASVAELNFKSITDQMSAMMYEFPFRVPAYYALIIRSMVTLEGIAIGIEPDFKVLSKAYPYVAKRLLTDPSPELRASLRDLLFREEGFRWNRLENLLRNAKGSQDYKLDKVVNQATDFLFSERGELIRDRIVDEVVNTIDSFGEETLNNISLVFQEQLGMALQNSTPKPTLNAPVNSKNNAEHLEQIWKILQDTPGFDPMALLPLIPEILTKRETQEMGQKIASGLAQKATVRLIRTLFLQEEEKTNNGTSSLKDSALSLPPVKSKA